MQKRGCLLTTSRCAYQQLKLLTGTFAQALLRISTVSFGPQFMTTCCRLKIKSQISAGSNFFPPQKSGEKCHDLFSFTPFCWPLWKCKHRKILAPSLELAFFKKSAKHFLKGWLCKHNSRLGAFSARQKHQKVFSVYWFTGLPLLLLLLAERGGGSERGVRDRVARLVFFRPKFEDLFFLQP